MPKNRKYPYDRRYRQSGTSRNDVDDDRADRPVTRATETLQRLANPNMDWRRGMPPRGWPKRPAGRGKQRRGR